MKKRYHIRPEVERDRLSDGDIARHRDTRRLLYGHQRAMRLIHRKPLYKDPKAFLAILLIVLLAIFIAEVVEKEGTQERTKTPSGTTAPGPQGR